MHCSLNVEIPKRNIHAYQLPFVPALNDTDAGHRNGDEHRLHKVELSDKLGFKIQIIHNGLPT